MIFNADTVATELISVWESACDRVKAATADEANRQAEVYKYIDDAVGKDKPALLIFNGFKAGRSESERGGGLNKGRLLAWLREKGHTELYNKLVVEEVTTTYHINDSALMALAALDPALNAAVEAATDKGTPTLSVVRPQKAGKEVIAAAVDIPVKSRSRK